jgi:hypothetical protein
MKRILAILLLTGLTGGTISAQKITREETFGVKYPINSIGYPSKIVPNEKGAFSYVEFWTPGQGRQFANHYLQTYNAKFEEEWFKPLTKKGSPRVNNIVDVVRLKDGIAVVGEQYSPSIKRMAHKMQLFELRGQGKGTLTTISNYTKKAKKGFEEVMDVSPDQSKMLWLGHNPGAKYKKRVFYTTVTDYRGRRVWGKKLLLAPTLDKYLVKQAIVDNRGNAYFYMVYEKATNTAEDTLYQPRIVRYDYKETKFSTYQLDFPGASVPEGYIHVTNNGRLAFLGVLADGSENGFVNGAKRFETGLKWNKLVYQQFEIQRELKQTQNYVMDFPESWVERYGGERGANFSKGEIVEDGDRLYWVMEEFYTQIHREQLQYLFYDVAVVAIDGGSGEIAWANTFEKKQRDYKSGRLLSYCLGLAKGKLNFVYLNERGAQGRILCTSMSLSDGSTETKDLARNNKATYLFFPKRSSMVDSERMILMGVGNPVGNDYKLMEVTFE